MSVVKKRQIMFAEASLIEHNLNLPKLTTSLDGLSESLRNYLSQLRMPFTSHVPNSRICLTPEILSHDVNRWSSSGVSALKLAAPNAQIHKFSKTELVSGLASNYTLLWWGG